MRRVAVGVVERPMMLHRVGRLVVGGLALVVGLAGLLMPERYWPAGWVPYREYEGELAGRPVVLAAPSVRKATVPLEYHIEMRSGFCEISRVDAAGRIIPYSRMGSGHVLMDTLPAGEQLQLDPGSGAGHYLVRIGPRFHPMAPFLRRCVAGGMLFGLVGSLVSRRRQAAWGAALKSAFRPWQWAVLTAVAVGAGAFGYGALHESGHALAVLALGGQVNDVVFTMLGGEEPHVNIGYLPEEARPWMAAAGIFLPIVVAYGVLIVWFALGWRLSRFGQALLLTPALLLLVASFGSLFDDHLRGMALRLGFSSPAEILAVKSIPVWLTLVAYAAVGWRLWRRMQRSAGEQ